ncbi:MAG: methylated-DNA--[protein]-cysteine S-methyltransferase [Methylobacteriaceae bacterium]|nr:methylated-DNA--[protein]-cysteine S-methyltransferase [Methylobacteriaceae bacterium]
MSALVYRVVDSPVGPLLVAGEGEVLRRVVFPSGSRSVAAGPDWRRDDGAFAEAVRQLAAYFAGELKAFDLPLAPDGTAFQRRVWEELTRIPYGETLSYAEVARRIGRPTATRAVGASNGANPLPIVVPCHRVVGANGSLTGFGGGLPTKRYLLALEQGAGPMFAR